MCCWVVLQRRVEMEKGVLRDLKYKTRFFPAPPTESDDVLALPLSRAGCR